MNRVPGGIHSFSRQDVLYLSIVQITKAFEIYATVGHSWLMERGLWAHYTEWRMAVPSNINLHYKKRTYVTVNIFILIVMHLPNFKVISQVGQIGQKYQATKLYWTAKKQNNETEQPINWKFSSLIPEQSLIVCFIFFNSVTKYFLILSCNLVFTSICPCLLGSSRKKILIPFHEQALNFTYKKPPMSSLFLPFFHR